MTEKNISWTDEALKALEKVPDFVRPMAKEMIEGYAYDEGAAEITPELMIKARARFGM